MKIVLRASLLLLLCLNGCSTKNMKGTPFVSGEYTNTTGRHEDRVNLWPLLYYNDPALSVLWPLGEHTDTSLAFRPLFSLYRDAPGKRYSELNILWPFSHFSFDSGSQHLFPFFWGKDYFTLFPFYWHGGSPFDDNSTGYNSLFPLWIYSNTSAGYDFHLLWPIFNSYARNVDDHGWYVFPLAGYDRSGATRSAYWLCWLGGFSTTDTFSTSWFIPFYYADREGSDSTFLSLLWGQQRTAAATTTIIPPLLSWHSSDVATDTSSLYALGGLYHRKTEGDNLRREWLFPLYARGDDYFLSLPYSHFDNTTLIPPLLSWQTSDPATKQSDFYALAGLFHNRSGAGDRNRSWLMPFYYDDHDTFASPLLLSWHHTNPATKETNLNLLAGLYHSNSDTSGIRENWLFPFYYYNKNPSVLVTPFWAHSFDENNELSWNTIPPLLSWQLHEAATDTTSLYILSGLYHRKTQADNLRREWLFPLYARGDDYFFSLPYSHFGNTTLIPPLLSWQTSDPATKQSDFYALVGLFHNRSGAGDENRSWFLPLYYDDRDTFASPLLLSWHNTHPATGVKDFVSLAGLFHQRYNTPDQHNAGHFIPFYAYSTSDYFLTLLAGYWKNEDAQTNYYLTPLIGSSSGRDRSGNWFFPLYSHSTRGTPLRTSPLQHIQSLQRSGDNSQVFPSRYASDTYLLLGILGSSRSQSYDMKTSAPSTYTERASNHVFLLWHASDNTDITFNSDLTAIQKDYRLEQNSFLLFLYDYRREHSQTDNHDYIRRRILWRLMHYEKLNGDTTLDIFPAITWDTKADGSFKTSFLWRFFRYEKPAAGNTKLDILFIPILR